MAVDVLVDPVRGDRRTICPVDVSMEELAVRHGQEVGQLDGILAAFDVESAWRTEHRTAVEPAVHYQPGQRGDIELRANHSWRPGSSAADSALVHVLLDASGADEDFVHWLVGDGPYTFVYLVTPPESARHLPEELAHDGRKVGIRRFAWTREPKYGAFDPMAMAVWYDLAGPTMALRRPVLASTTFSFKKAPGEER